MDKTTRIGRRSLFALGGMALAAMTLATLSNGAGAQDGTPPASPEASPKASPVADGQTRVRFTYGDVDIVVKIADSPTSRDFLSMLPLELEFQDFNRFEKLSYLPRELTTEGATEFEPKNGDLIYFIPWGNIGFYYDVDRRDASFDNRVLLIGSIETGQDQLGQLEGSPVKVEVVS